MDSKHLKTLPTIELIKLIYRYDYDVVCLNQELAAETDRANALETENKQLTVTNQQLTNKLEATKKNLAKTRAEVGKYKEVIRSLISQQDEAETQIRAKEDQIDVQHKYITYLQAQVIGSEKLDLMSQACCGQSLDTSTNLEELASKCEAALRNGPSEAQLRTTEEKYLKKCEENSALAREVKWLREAYTKMINILADQSESYDCTTPLESPR